MSQLLEQIKRYRKLKTPVMIGGVEKQSDGNFKDVSKTISKVEVEEEETLDEGFFSSITTAVSLSKTVQIQKRIERKKFRQKNLHTLPRIQDDLGNINEVFQKLDANLHMIQDALHDSVAIAKDDAVNLSKLIAIGTFATRLFLNPTKRKQK